MNPQRKLLTHTVFARLKPFSFKNASSSYFKLVWGDFSLFIDNTTRRFATVFQPEFFSSKPSFAFWGITIHVFAHWINLKLIIFFFATEIDYKWNKTDSWMKQHKNRTWAKRQKTLISIFISIYVCVENIFRLDA